MFVLAEIAAWFGIFLMFVMFVAVAGSVCAVSKIGSRALAVLLVGGLLFSIVLVVGWVAVSHKRPIKIAQDNESARAVQVSTEQMWEHLNRPRIVLESDENTTSKAKNKTNDSKTPSPQVLPAKRASPENGGGGHRMDSEPAESVRPAWVDHPPKRVGNVYRVAVSSEPYRDTEECHQALGPLLSVLVMQRVSQLADGGDSPTLAQLGLGLDFVLREICLEEWVETVEASFGEMKAVHVLLEFDTAVDNRLRSAFRSYQREGRITRVGGIAGLGLGGLALLFGLLKLDTWTRGYYTKRLFFGVPAAIIAIVALLK